MGITKLRHVYIHRFLLWSRVIIDDFDIISVALGPSEEADTPLIINSNAHLACPIAYRSLLFPCRNMPVPQADPQVRSPAATASSKAGMHWASTADAPDCHIHAMQEEHAVIDPVRLIPIFRMGGAADRKE
jgi:hypothetical protein